MSNTYSIDTLFEGEEIGVWPQIQALIPLSTQDNILERKTVELKNNYKITLNEKAKLTDFLSSAELMNAFIVSKKVQDIFKNFNLGNSYFKPVIINQGTNVIKGYCMLIIDNNLGEKVKFNESNFFIAHRMRPTKDKVPGYVNIDSWKGLSKMRREIKRPKKQSVYLENIVIDKSEEKQDIFNIPATPKVFISTRLKTALEAENISGFATVTTKLPRITFN
tara:strand:+ start:21 stop:683 length:663 start_codon:yes stop_codon:yes gene_type:complete